MTSSIAGGLIRSGWPADQITVSDPMDEQRKSLQKQLGIRTTADNLECLEASDIVVLAVKPQVLKQVVGSIASGLRARKPLVVSIAAGIPSASILGWIGSELPLVRVMPNTPALVGQGVSGLYATSATSAEQRALTTKIMAAVGATVWVDSEPLIDTVTGVSGSGPAYFFKLMELMIDQGVEDGLDPADARKLVVETGLGAATLLRDSELSAGSLRRQVTSPNGTTEAGVEAMEQAGIDRAVREGVSAAIRRSRELSSQFGEN